MKLKAKNKLPPQIGIYCHTLRVGKDISNWTQNARTTKDKTTLKLRDYVHAKTPLRK